MLSDPGIAKRLQHIFAFFTAMITVSALAIALKIRLEVTPISPADDMLIANPKFLTGVLWIGGAGGFACATIIATKTAWSVFSWKNLRGVLDQKGE